MEEKEEALRRRQAEEEAWAAQMRENMAKAAEREAWEARVRAEANRRMTSELDEQVRLRSTLSSRERAHARQQDKEELQQWSRDAEEAARREADRRARVAADQAEMMRQNKVEAEIRGKIAAREREEDEARLQAALAHERAEEERERAFADRQKAEARAHQKALEAQLAVQREADDALDKLYAEAQEAEWKKREDVWNADAESRRRLMKEVDATRQLQMRLKAEAEAKEKEEEAADAAYISRMVAEEASKREAAWEQKRAIQAKVKGELGQQMAEREAVTRAEKQAEYLSWKLMQKEERQYMDKVSAILAEPIPEGGYRRQKVEWYN
jgi:hypothetical protein